MDTHSTKKGGAGKYICFILLLLIVLAVTTVLLYLQGLGSAYKPDDESYVQIEIPEGTSASGISSLLEENNVVRHAREFSLYSRIHHVDNSFQAGVYALSPSLTMAEIAQIISTGKVNTIKITIPEGYTEYDIAKAVAKEDGIDRKKFIKLLESGKYEDKYSFLEDAQDNEHKLEGYLVPDTYSVTAGMSEDEIIRMLLDAHKDLRTKKALNKAKKLKRSWNEIIIIASIIEKECVAVSDQPLVSSVIYNRLKKDMPLQMDSTIQYVLELGGEHKEDMLYDDTEIESPYNTYTNPGLPAGPICCPGKSAIEAALNPAKTKYLYFVVDDALDGTMAFSEDYNDFLADKDAYYAAREEEG